MPLPFANEMFINIQNRIRIVCLIRNELLLQKKIKNVKEKDLLREVKDNGEDGGWI